MEGVVYSFKVEFEEADSGFILDLNNGGCERVKW